MSRTFRVMILLALGALAWMVTPAYSTTLTYTDLALWTAATSGDTTIDFEGLTPGGPITYYNTATGVSSYTNVDFIGYDSTNSPYLRAVDTTYAGWAAYYDFGSGVALAQLMDRSTAGSPPLPYIHVVFTTPVTAFGSDLFSASPAAMSFAITVLGTQYTAPTFAKPTRAFWGITSDTPISSADFTLLGTDRQGGTLAFLDNFVYGTAGGPVTPPDPTGDTPEAATMLLIGSGLLGLVWLRKRAKPVFPV